jgi:predicted transposase/invertase (TIGR01784 family)
MSGNKEKRTLVSFDWAIKSILKKPEHFDVLEGFLAALLADDNIKILEILESESTQRDEFDKYNRVDLKARDGAGKVIIIELQVKKETDYLSRMYYGTSKVISEHMRLGYAYGELPKVISISIVYFDFMKDCYVAKSEMRFRDMNDGKYLSGLREEIFAEYYFIQPEWFDGTIKSGLDEWVYMLKHSEIAEGSRSKNIERAGEALDFAKMSAQEQSDYDYYWNISVRSALNTIDAAKQDARQEGEKNKAIEMAKEMLADGEPLTKIIKYTKLTEAEIKDIAKQMNIKI